MARDQKYEQLVTEQIAAAHELAGVLDNKAFQQVVSDMANEFYLEFLSQAQNPSHLLIAHLRATVLREIIGRMNQAVQAGHVGAERLGKMKE